MSGNLNEKFSLIELGSATSRLLNSDDDQVNFVSFLIFLECLIFHHQIG